MFPIVSPTNSISIEPNFTTVSNGENAQFNCTADGGPNNMFIWARTSDAININLDFSGTNGAISVKGIQNEFADISVSNESLLSFFVSSPANEGGRYTCFVFNRAGVDNANATLHVNPFIVTSPQPQYVAVGESTTLTCVGESFPSPTYQWQRISSSNIVTILTGEASTTLNVTLDGFNDFANSYQCIVTANGTDNAITSSPASITGNVLLSKSSSLFDIIIYVTQFLIIICIILIILFIIVITVCDTLCDYLDNVKGAWLLSIL